MTTADLIRWIDSHDRTEPTIDNGDGTLIVASALVKSTGDIRIERQVIPATMDSARHLLGYWFFRPDDAGSRGCGEEDLGKN